MYDLIIVGGGIAGMTSAIYAARRSMKVLILSGDLGGQMAKTPDIENWPGEISVNGAGLANKMKAQVDKLEVEFKFEVALKIKKSGKNFKVNTKLNSYETKTIILAFGKVPRTLKIPGEKEFVGKGISYCVNCDGPFFKKKDVAIIGGGNSAIDAALVMSDIANKVYLIHRKDKFRAESYLIEKLKTKDNVEIIMESKATNIEGLKTVEKLTLDPIKELLVSAVFIEVGYIVNDSLVDGLIDTDEKGQIKVDNNQQTSVPGIFAAGDLTNTPFQQLVIAAGEAATATLSAYDYIQKV